MSKPQIKHYPAHGSGMIACYDVAEMDTYMKELESRVAVLDAQEVKLPELDVTECDLAKAIGWMAGAYVPSEGTLQAFAEYLACRERQLLDALRAVKAWRGVALRFRGADPVVDCSPACTPEDCPFKAYDALAGKGGE